MKVLSKEKTAEEAIKHIKDGDRIMIGGFGLRGAPYQLEDELIKRGSKNLTVITVGADSPGIGIGEMLRKGQIRRLIGSFFNANTEVAEYRNQGLIDVELMPMGTFAEAIRAGGMGIPAFYVPAAVGTELEEGKEVRSFGGRQYVMQEAIHADVALIKAKKADRLGNLIYSKVARSFNPTMATAADYTIALVEEIVEPGEISPEEIVTSHIYVDAIVQMV